MAMPDRECPHCAEPLTAVRMLAEEVLVSVTDGHVAGAQRVFVGECPEHGEIFAEHKMGHHATLGEAVMKRRYSKLARSLIVAKSTSEQSRAFKLSLEGKRSPTDEEIRYWDHLSIGARVAPSTAWMIGARVDLKVELTI